jgi:hypothetical protein
MKTLNLKATMNSQNHRRAVGFAHRLVTSATTLCLCVAWLALPGSVRGQPTNYADENAVTNYVRQLLYWPDAVATNRNQAAFRYKHLLYGEEAGKVRARLETMVSLYGEAERNRSKDAEGHLKGGLTNNPASATLGQLLLDIYYDRTAAEAILAKQAFANADYVRFAQTSAPPAWVIDAEITAYDQALQANRSALGGYLTLFTNSLDTADVDATPLGYRLFQQGVPFRALAPATRTNAVGQSVAVITNAGPLFTGYKDLVLLYDLLRDQGRTVKESVRLRLCRGNPADSTNALSLVTEAERFLYLRGELLRGAFPGLAPVEGDPSGLAEAMAGCTQGLADLGTLRQFLTGKRNVLGFEPDFLMLVQKFTGAATYYDSYDALRERLIPANAVGPLGHAKADWIAARGSYASYRGFEDHLADQFGQLTGSAKDRLWSIAGAYPEDPDYETPQKNQGCEIWQQLQSIEVAKLRIQRNAAEMSNLSEEVNIELARSNLVSEAYVKYANKRASIAETIGHINAVQAAANEAATAASGMDATNPLSFVGTAAHAVNAVVQAGAEEWKGQLEAEKERQSGLEQAEIEGFESAARVKTLLLGMNTLAIDSQEAALLLTQEIGRLTALAREKENLERSLAETPEGLAGRYFADPSHRLCSQGDMLRASLSFDEAQKWMFFMTRALEYKWNQRFTNSVHGGRTWSSASIFKLRNASELEDMWRAMDAYEQLIAGTVIVGANRFDWFSVRKDFLGFQDGRLYDDPVTGLQLDPISAFRTNLLRRLVTVGNGRECIIEFDTVRQIPGGFFFVGPIFTTNQPPTVYDKGRFLDKINYLKLRLVGQSMTYTTPLAGRLSYGGTSYLRNPRVGTFDPIRPDRLRNEMTTYSTRYWFNFGYRWEFTDTQLVSDAYMERSLTHDPITPPGTAEIWDFKERSVAATGWKLAIPTISQGTRVLYLHELDDVIIYFQHRSAQRQ